MGYGCGDTSGMAVEFPILFDTLISSIRNRLWPLGNDVAFIPGHGPMSTFGAERRSNPFCGG
ncbi:MAG TPA: hypothetical protein PKN13_15540, partial [Accumulibacter sp.]|nr:hypothetical protein [Accumulibacter sp.]HNM76713.1 hypothetical protein [Accumulibacter sp.]